MKKIILMIFVLAMCLNSEGQNMGEIIVNEQFTATLKFNDDINFIITGNNPQIGENDFKYFNIFQSGNTCTIRGNDKNATMTSITIKLNSGDVFYGILKYGEGKKIFYDFSDVIKKEIKESEKIEEIKVIAKEEQMQSRLHQLMTERPFYSTLGVLENGMEYQVSNIRNDEKYTYVKIIIRNKTGGDYNIDGIFFKYTEGKRKGLKKKEAQIEERIFTVYESSQKVVPAYKTEEFGFVIPLFTVGKKGSLEVQIRELAGTRNPVIEIEGSEMLKVKIFE